MDRASVILLAGGIGTRMGNSIPKQFLTLHGKPIAHYSLDCFLSLSWITEIIIVVEPQYQHYFENYRSKAKFALPGKERQDSVYSGLQSTSLNTSWICVHDAARPFIQPEEVNELFLEAKKTGAAALGVPVKFTVKECSHSQIVVQTLPRSKLWEIQTPQIIANDLLKRAFKYCLENNLTVTDDVSLVEHLNEPVKIVKGGYCNIKITTPEDLIVGETLVQRLYGSHF